MVRPIEQGPVCLSLEEVTVHADHKVVLKVDDICVLTVSTTQGILRPEAELANPIPLVEYHHNYIYYFLNCISVNYQDLYSYLLAETSN
jgi:hypothetical protein